MKKSINLNIKTMASNIAARRLALLTSVALLMSVTTTSVLASAELDSKALQKKVDTVLINTEKAIASLRIDGDLSLEKIDEAMEQIKKLESVYTAKVTTETDSKHNTEIAKSYTHFYPPLGETLTNAKALPNLSYKINSDILYKGQKDNDSAYLDYTFAKASLMTAKDTINDGDKLEAMANLKRVFEAVYLAPDFDVADANS